MKKNNYYYNLFTIFIFLFSLVCCINPSLFSDLEQTINFYIFEDIRTDNNSYENYTKVDFYKRSLSMKEQYVYDLIYQNAINNNENLFEIPEVTVDTLDKIYKCVLYDNEEIFYIKNLSYQSDYVGYAKRVILTYTCDLKTRKLYEEQLKVLSIKALAEMENLSKYEKVEFAHNYIIQNTDYNSDAVDNQNILSVFLNKESVCAGYSKAYQYLLKRSGVYCVFVPGTSIIDGRNEPHAWNLVKLDDEDFYYIDTTFDDSDFFSSKSIQKYNYFNITTQELLKSHAFDKTMPDLPKANCTENNYFNKKDLYFQKYDNETKSSIKDLIIKAIEKNESYINFKFSNNEDFNEFQDDFEKNDYHYLFSLAKSKVDNTEKFVSRLDYSFDEYTNVNTIFLYYE